MASVVDSDGQALYVYRVDRDFSSFVPERVFFEEEVGENPNIGGPSEMQLISTVS